MKFLTNGFRKVSFLLACGLRVLSVVVGKAWGQENEDASHTVSAGRRWEGMLAVGLLDPFPLFDSVLGPSHGMVPPTSRVVPPL